MKAAFSERDVFSAYLRLCPDVPPGEITYTERPDVLVRQDRRTLGYEITQLYHRDSSGRPASVQHGQGDAIVDKAERICTERGHEPLIVDVAFAIGRDLSKQRWPELAAILADIVSSHLPPVGGHWEWENDYWGGVPDDIQSILVINAGPDGPSHWSHGGVGWAQTEIAHELQAAIDTKAALLPAYLQQCDECSLIVAVGGLPGVSAIMPSAEHLSRTFDSPFKETFFIRILDERCVRLTTRPPR